MSSRNICAFSRDVYLLHASGNYIQELSVVKTVECSTHVIDIALLGISLLFVYA